MENQSVPNIQNSQQLNDAPFDQSPTSKQKTSFVWPVLITFLISAIVFGFGGYYLGKWSFQTKQYVNQNQITPTSSPETSPMTNSVPKASLKTYTSSFEKLSFQYPSDWRPYPNQPQSDSPEGDALGIQDPSGKVKVSWVSAINGLGGSCDPNIPFNQAEGEMGAPCPLFEVVDSQKLTNVDLYYVTYVVTRDGVKYEPVFALQDKDGILTTKRTLGYLFFNGKNNGKVLAGLSGNGLVSGTKTAAQNFFSTPEAIQTKNIFLSITY